MQNLLLEMDSKIYLDNEIYASLSHLGFPNYLVTSHGRVFNKNLGKELQGYVDNGGYRRVTLKCLDNSKCTRTIHGLVGITFLQKIEGINMTIDHIDRNNLRWATKSE